MIANSATLDGMIPEGLSPAARALIERRRAARPSPAGRPTPRRPSDAPVPLSFEQQSLWLAQRMASGPATYHIPFAPRIVGALDVAALRSALGDLVARHEALR